MNQLAYMTKTKLTAWCESVIEAGWLAALIVTPLFFNVFSSRVFEPDKISLVRTTALIMLLAYGIKVLGGGAVWLPRHDGTEAEESGSWRWRLLRTPFFLPILLMVISYGISTYFSVAPRVSWWGSYQRLQGTYTFFSYVIIAVLTAGHLRTPDQIRRLQHAVVIISLPIAIYGIVQKMELDPLPWGGDVVSRVSANAGNPIFLSAYLIMAFFLTLERVYSSFAYLLSAQGDGVSPSEEKDGSSHEWASVLAGGSYLFVLVVQAVAILFTQSRGPWLGWFVGIYLFVLFLVTGLRGRNYKVWTAFWVGLGVMGVAVVLLLNTVFYGSFSGVPYLSRMTRILESESGTGLVRVLIWEGASKMVAPHPPITFPDGHPDSVNVIRPLIGYGPEAMWVAYNSFYPPALAQVEARNASPDRSHNETWDSLAITGGLGFVAYVVLFLSIFFYALSWLGLITNRRDIALFLGLWLGGGIGLATASFFLDGQQWRYLGVALPVGFLAGLVFYMTLAVFMHDREGIDRLDLPRQLLIVAIMATVAAHFMEIHTGIAIAATRVYFWVLTALMFTVGMGLSRVNPFAVDALSPSTDVDLEEDLPQSRGRSQRRGNRTHRSPSRSRRGSGALPSLPATIMTDLMVFFTLVFIYTTNPRGLDNAFRVMGFSLARRVVGSEVVTSPAILVLILFTWLIAVTISLTVEALQHRETPSGRWWVRGYALHAVVVLGGWLLYGLIQGSRLAPMAAGTGLQEQLSHVAGHFSVFTWLMVSWIIGAGTVYSWKALGQLRFPSPNRMAITLGAGVVLTILCFFFISIRNVALVRADIFYKQGQQFDNSRDWVSSIELYSQALDVRATEDHYLLFLGRGLLERSRQAPVEGAIQIGGFQTVQDVLALTPTQVSQMGRENLLQAAEVVLLDAQELNPLNTDHTANLARLYRNWSELTTDETRRSEMQERSIKAYEQAVMLSPNAAHLWNEKGIMHSSRGENAEAEASWLHSLTLDQKFDQTYLLLAEFYDRQGEQDKLVDILNRGIITANSNVQMYSFLGVALARTGNLTGALEANLSAIKLAPQDAVTLRNLALISRDMGRMAEAADWAVQAAQATPDPTTILQMRQLAAGLYQELGQPDLVIAQYEAMRVADGENVSVLNTLGNLYIQGQQLEPALEVMQALSGIEPNNFQHPLRIGQIYVQLGRADVARQFGDRALQLAPEDQKATVEQFLAGLN